MDPLQQKILKNRYQLERELGSGGMARVYLAVDTATQQKVAIKMLTSRDKLLCSRFLREYKLLQAVQHENLIRAYDYFTEQSHFFMVLEFVEGQTMEALLAAPQRLSLVEQLAVANKIARAAEVLNAAGILHRDIKPGNIIVEQTTAVVKLLDLGIGKELEGDNLTLPKMILGTIAYLSPEQTRGEVSPQSDVFSLGITLHQFFSWQQHSPFFHPHPVAMIHDINHVYPPSLLEVFQQRLQLPQSLWQQYQDLSEVIAKAMEKRPQDRWDDCGEMAERFAEIQRKILSTKRLEYNENMITLCEAPNPQLLKILDEIKNDKEQGPAKPKARVRRMKRDRSTSKFSRRLLLMTIAVFFAVVGLVAMAVAYMGNTEEAEQHFQKSLLFYSRTKFTQAWLENESACAITADPRYLAHKARMIFYGRGAKKDERLADEIARRQLPLLLKNDDSFSSFAIGHMYRNGYGAEKDYQKAFYWHSQSAREWNSHAMINLAVMYKNGEAVPKDEEQAIIWYTRAVQLDDSLAMTFLGNLYENQKRYDKALSLYQQAVAQENIYAMVYLGLLHYYGFGTEQSYQKALLWLNKAADLGSATAMRIIAGIYESGRGVEKDLLRAIFWYEKAIVAGDIAAITQLGVMYANGKGVAKDYTRAIQLFQQAADKNDANAMKLLGDMHRLGFGTEQSRKQAVFWYHKAAEKGNDEAMWRSGLMYVNGDGIEKNYSLALQLLKKAVEAGNPKAMKLLGDMNKMGVGVPINAIQAALWYEQAATKGEPEAMTELGIMYGLGSGVKRDYQRSFELLSKAAEAGEAKAMANLGLLYAFGHLGSKDYALANYWYQRASAQNDDGATVALRRLRELLDGK